MAKVTVQRCKDGHKENQWTRVLQPFGTEAFPKVVDMYGGQLIQNNLLNKMYVLIYLQTRIFKIICVLYLQ